MNRKNKSIFETEQNNKMMKRRQFLIKTGVACAGITILPTLSCSTKKKETQTTTFELPSLGYDYTALEPNIDARTMEIHHTKHHAGYVRNLNKALENNTLKGQSLETICKSVSTKTADIALVNNGGGHYNHSLFWEILTPNGDKQPKGKLLEAIQNTFGSFEAFTELFAKTGLTLFGSGWAWLIVNKSGILEVTATQNQENPLMEKIVDVAGTPILGIDVWEHAYYLKYQNRRADYIQNLMKLINWTKVAEKFDATK